jgi:hypothetical protein
LFSTYGNESNGYELNSIDEDRKILLTDQKANYGHVKVAAFANQTENWLTNKKQSAWDRFWGKSPKKENNSIDRISTLNDVTWLEAMSPELFSENFYVNKHDAEEVQGDCKDFIKGGNRVVFFRFAMTEHFAANARFDWADEYLSKEDGFVSQQTVFLEFDVLSLTFRSDLDDDVVIGVVADPVDIFSGTEPPDDMDNPKKSSWWKKLGIILGAIAGAIGLYFFGPWLVSGISAVFSMLAGLIGPVLILFVALGKWLFKGLIWVIKAPFKLIGKAFHKEE